MNGAHDHPWEGRDRHYKGERRRGGKITRARRALKNVLDRICGEPDTLHSRDAALLEDPRYDNCPGCGRPSAGNGERWCQRCVDRARAQFGGQTPFRRAR